jgi:hypothetical protein
MKQIILFVIFMYVVCNQIKCITDNGNMQCYKTSHAIYESSQERKKQ